MTYNTDNIFAKILRKEIPTDFIYEDDYVVAFKDIHPKAPVHLLVLPKGAYTDYTDMLSNADEEEILGFSRAIVAVARQNGLVEGGYRIVFNVGAGAGQEVPHLHAHILAGF